MIRCVPYLPYNFDYLSNANIAARITRAIFKQYDYIQFVISYVKHACNPWCLRYCFERLHIFNSRNQMQQSNKIFSHLINEMVPFHWALSAINLRAPIPNCIRFLRTMRKLGIYTALNGVLSAWPTILNGIFMMIWLSWTS